MSGGKFSSPETYFGEAMSDLPLSTARDSLKPMNSDSSLYKYLDKASINPKKNTRDMMLELDGPSMEFSLPLEAYVPQVKKQVDSLEESVEDMRKELENLKQEDVRLSQQETELQLERDRLQLMVEEAQSKKRLASLAKYKAKLRTPEEIDAKFGDSC